MGRHGKQRQIPSGGRIQQGVKLGPCGVPVQEVHVPVPVPVENRRDRIIAALIEGYVANGVIAMVTSRDDLIEKFNTIMDQAELYLGVEQARYAPKDQQDEKQAAD